MALHDARRRTMSHEVQFQTGPEINTVTRPWRDTPNRHARAIDGQRKAPPDNRRGSSSLGVYECSSGSARCWLIASADVRVSTILRPSSVVALITVCAW